MSAKFQTPRPKATGETENPNNERKVPFAIYENHDGDRLRWSAPFPLPQVGDRIVITMNGIGEAVVTGFFEEAGYVGVMAKTYNPPSWLVEQRKRNRPDAPQWLKEGNSTVFGSEIDMA